MDSKQRYCENKIGKPEAILTTIEKEKYINSNSFFKNSLVVSLLLCVILWRCSLYSPGAWISITFCIAWPMIVV